jgi:hypothetical protein
MTAYRIRACMGGSSIDQVVEADNAKQAILKVSEQVDQGNVEIINDGFTGNKRVHITYEELK